MSGLGRRMDALEAIAEEVRLRPYRLVAEARGIPFEELMERVAHVRAGRHRMQARGLTDRQIVEAKAADLGITPDELLRRVDALQQELGRLLERSS